MNRKLSHLTLTISISLFLILSGYLPLMTLNAKGHPSVDIPLKAQVEPISNTHTAPITSSVSLSYTQAIIPKTVTSRTIVIHAMQTGQITQRYSVNGEKIRITPKLPFKSGELIQVTATTQTLSYHQDKPFTPTVWQFRTAVTVSNGLLADSGQRLGNAYSYGAALGDLDGDGDIDVISADYNRPNEVWFNLGDGQFVNSEQRLGEADSTSVVLGDVDGDGDLDAFVANWDETNKLWLNDGQGYFTDSQQGFGESYAAAMGDMDGDGDLDIFTGKRLWFNDGNGTYSASKQLFVLPPLKAGAVAIGDLDQDYDLDMIVSDSSLKNNVWLNQGNGSFELTVQNLDKTFSTDMVLGDVDNDQDLDLLIVDITNRKTQLWLNAHNGFFINGGQSLQSNSGVGATFVDIDGDGDLDAIVGNPHPSIPPKRDKEGGASVWLNDGQGHFRESDQHLGKSSVSKLVTADLDGDGDVEIVMANLNQPNTIWFNDELPVLQLKHTSSLTIAQPGSQVEYTIQVSNSGAVLIDDVVVTVDLPPYSKLHSTDGRVKNNQITWSRISLGLNERRFLHYTLHLDNPIPPDVASLESKAIAQGANQYGNPVVQKESYQLFIQHPGRPFLTLATSGPPTATLNSTIPYSFTVQHHPFSTSKIPVSHVFVYHTLTTQPLTIPIQGDVNNDGWLDVNEKWLFADSYTVPPDTTADVLVNKSYATGMDEKNRAAVSPIPHDSHTVNIEYQPILQFDFTARLTELKHVTVNQPIIFDFKVEHAAGSDRSQLRQLNVMNSMTGQADCHSTILNRQPITCTATYLIQPTDTAPLIISGTVEGVDRNGHTIKASRHLTLPDISYQPQLSLTLHGPSQAVKGDAVLYTITLRHAAGSDGSSIDTLVITPSAGSAFHFLGDDDNRLSPNESWAYTATLMVKDAAPVPSQLMNAINVSGLGMNKQPVTAAITYVIEVAPFMLSVKTATLTAPTVGFMGQTYPFTVTVAPITATRPIKYRWAATEQREIEYNSQSPLEAVNFSWARSGLKTISLTVSNLTSTVTVSTVINVTRPNQAPVISQAKIIPANPDDQIDLTLQYDYEDLDGDDVEIETTWIADGLVQNSLQNSQIVPASLTEVNTQWCAQIVARDNRGGTSNMAKSCVRIQPGPLCKATQLEITPFGVTNAAQDLQLTYKLDCRGNLPAEAIVRWYRDGQLQPALNRKTTVSGTITVPFEAWYATVTACISGVCDAPLKSNTVYIAKRPNSPPTAKLTILPSAPLENESLKLIYSISDTDKQHRAAVPNDKTRIWWYRDDVYQPLYYKKNTITATETEVGEIWCVELQPHDGQEYGLISERQCVSIGSATNHAPQLSEVSAGQTIQSPQQPMKLSYRYQDLDKQAEDVAQRRLRWYRNGSYQPAFTGKAEIPARFLLAGDVWQAKLQGYDGQLWSVWTTTPLVHFSSPTQNTPSVIQNVRLEPAQPTANQPLQLMYDYQDVDGQQETDTLIYWYDNPLTRTKKFDGLTKIPAEELAAGQRWHVRVTPHDGQAYGEMVQARSVKINGQFGPAQANTPPFISNIFIDPEKPGVNDDLNVIYVYRDKDGDQEGETMIEWRVNGLVQTSWEKKRKVKAIATLLDDTWCAFVTPFDARKGVGEQVSACAKVTESGGRGENTPPIARNIYIDPPVATNKQVLNLYYTYIDVDGDKEAATEIMWYRIDKTTQQVEFMTAVSGTKYVPSELTTPGDQWYAKIRVHDGEDYGELTTTATILINRPPVVSNVQVIPSEANEGLTLQVDYDFIDPDEGIEGQSEIYWYLNRQRIMLTDTNPKQLPSHLTQQGQVLTVSVKPRDFYEYGAKVSSAEIIIAPPKLPGAIYLPVVVKSEPKPTATATTLPTTAPTLTPTATPAPCTPQRRYEPNNWLNEFCDVALNERITQTYPDDIEDYYRFIADDDASFSIRVTNYRAKGGQYDPYLIVYREVEGSFDEIGYDKLTDGEGQFNRELLRGEYRIRVYTDESGFNNNTPYTLEVKPIP